MSATWSQHVLDHVHVSAFRLLHTLGTSLIYMINSFAVHASMTLYLLYCVAVNLIHVAEPQRLHLLSDLMLWSLQPLYL